MLPQVKLPMLSHYTIKDQQKANIATCFIGQGSSKSSTNAYCEAYQSLANRKEYSSDDIVFVSVEGDRKNRISFDRDLVLKAITAGVTFVCDNTYNRNRLYNIGEREFFNFLLENGYEQYFENKYYSLIKPAI